MESTGGERGGSAAGDDGEPQHCCDLFRCFCCWQTSCWPRIPRVMPGRDYECMPPALGDGADYHHRPLCSVLLGCASFGSDAPPFHNLRLHRFRVAQSGRVIGQSDDLLEPFLAVSPSDVSSSSMISSHGDDVDDDDGQTTTEFYDAMAALGPDSKHLYIICVQGPVRKKCKGTEQRPTTSRGG